jgi:hypothetical protein
MADGMKSGTKGGGGKTLKIMGADASLKSKGKKKGGKKSMGMKLPGKK